MNIIKNNTEEKILAAAEEEFINKGYAGAKTTEIARKAGVTHAMLHYYYRTKEKLFQQIFQDKIQYVAARLAAAIDEGQSPMERIECMVRAHLDFVTGNHRLVLFIFNEVRQNEALFRMFLSLISPQVSRLAQRLDILIRQGVEQGTMRSVSSVDLLQTMLSLNLMHGFFLSLPLCLSLNGTDSSAALEHRREEVVETLLSRLRPVNPTINHHE